MHHFDVAAPRERFLQYREQRAVKFDGDHLPRGFGKLTRQAAHAGADLKRAAFLVCAALGRDPLGHPLRGQEILAERFGKMKAVPPEYVFDDVDITKSHERPPTYSFS